MVLYDVGKQNVETTSAWKIYLRSLAVLTQYRRMEEFHFD